MRPRLPVTLVAGLALTALFAAAALLERDGRSWQETDQ